MFQVPILFKKQLIFYKKNIDKQNKNWLIGYGWDQNQWKDKNWPNNNLLNEHFKDLNIVIHRIDGHVIMANEMAIKTAKVVLDTTIEGGYIEKIDQKITGLFVDNAMNLILEKIPKPDESSKKKSFTKITRRLFVSRTNYSRYCRAQQRRCRTYRQTPQI